MYPPYPDSYQALLQYFKHRKAEHEAQGWDTELHDSMIALCHRKIAEQKRHRELINQVIHALHTTEE